MSSNQKLLESFFLTNGLPFDSQMNNQLLEFGVTCVEDLKILPDDLVNQLFEGRTPIARIKANIVLSKLKESGEFNPSKTRASENKMKSTKDSHDKLGPANRKQPSKSDSSGNFKSDNTVQDNTINDDSRKQQLSLFYQNYVSVALASDGMNEFNNLDIWAWKHPHDYPEGDMQFVIESGDRPQFGWAFHNATSGGSNKKRLKCMGVFECSRENCNHRIRPQHKKTVAGHDKKVFPEPEEKKWCPTHGDKPHFKSCECVCKVTKITDGLKTVWRVEHTGSHNHSAPEPKTATKKAKNVLKDIVAAAPEITTTELISGNKHRKSITLSDIKFNNPDYLTHTKRQMNKMLSREITGLNDTFDAPDLMLETMRRLNEHFPGVILDSSLGGRNIPFFISFQTPELARLSTENHYAKQVDTLMSLCRTQYFQGKVYVTISSVMDPYMQKQVPCIVTIHTGQTTADYTMHFQADNTNFHHLKSEVNGNLARLLFHYPGITMDMSSALANGFRESFKDMCDKIFRIDDVPDDIFHFIHRLCTVHYTRNFNAVSRISKIIDPKKARIFRMLCRVLISEGITFDEFESAIKEILSRFPNAKGWLNWYLHPHRACHLFPACNQSDLHDGMSDKFIKQSKDTNAQEGFGKFFKQWVGAQGTLYDLIRETASLMMTYERQGVDQTYMGVQEGPKSVRMQREKERKTIKRRRSIKKCLHQFIN